MHTDTRATYRPVGPGRRALFLAAAGVLALALLLVLLRGPLRSDRIETAVALEKQADAHYAGGDFEQADRLYGEALEMRSRLFGPEAPPPANTLLKRGKALAALDRFEEALDCYRRSIELCSAPGGDRQTLVEGFEARAGLNLSLDLYQRAEPDFREALRLRQADPKPKPDPVAEDWRHLAECLEGQKRFEAADSACDSSLSLLRRPESESRAGLAESVIVKGRIQIRQNRAADAEAYLREGVSLCERLLPPSDLKLLEARSLLGWCLLRLGRLEEAEPLLLRSYSGQSLALGTEDKQVRETAGHLAELYERWRKPDLFAHYQALATGFHPSDSTE